MEHESLDPGRATADVTTLRRWLRELEDERDIFKRTLDKRDAEIERLRGLLREALEDGYIRIPYGASHEDVSAIRDFEKRIREAL